MFAAALLAVNACAPGRLGPASQERVWPAYLGSAARTSTVQGTLAADPQPVWRTVLARGLVGAPALAEDVVAVSQVDGQVALLARETGDILWRHRLGAPPGAGPLLSDDRVFVPTQTEAGSVVALRLNDGNQVWSTRVGDVVAPLTLRGDALYAATSTGWIIRLDPSTGQRRWRVRVSGAVRTAPLAVGGGVVVATDADSILLLDAESGAVRARRGTTGTPRAALALSGGTIFVGTTTGQIAALDTATLESHWTREIGSPVVGTIAVRDGRLYALTDHGHLWILPLSDPAHGTESDLGLVARAGPAPAPGGVFVASVEGEVARVDSAGNRTWSARMRPPIVEPPIPDGTMLFAVSERGVVAAFR